VHVLLDASAESAGRVPFSKNGGSL
jgi:hypothetical protein